MHSIPLPVLGAFLLALYCLPSIVAFLRRHRGLFWLCPLNLCLGWTVVGWCIALHFALSRRHTHPYMRIIKGLPVVRNLLALLRRSRHPYASRRLSVAHRLSFR